MTTSAPPIRTGGMRQRAELQSKVNTSDGAGGASAVWSKERDLWCQIMPIVGRQQIEAMHQRSKVTHVIYARYAADITTAKRIVNRSVVYNIEAVSSPDERQEFVHIVASTGEAT